MNKGIWHPLFSPKIDVQNAPKDCAASYSTTYDERVANMKHVCLKRIKIRNLKNSENKHWKYIYV
jgi:hypothetical protein